jgi:hypothetical protein
MMRTNKEHIVWAIWFGLLIVSLFILKKPTVQSTSESSPITSLKYEDRELIATALRDARLPEPQSLDINNVGYLVATFEPAQPPSRAAAETFATTALFAIRNVMGRRNVVSNYRVTLNGPALGRGLVLRYGSALFSEGGSLDWQPR